MGDPVLDFLFLKKLFSGVLQNNVSKETHKTHQKTTMMESFFVSLRLDFTKKDYITDPFR